MRQLNTEDTPLNCECIIPFTSNDGLEFIKGKKYQYEIRTTEFYFHKVIEIYFSYHFKSLGNYIIGDTILIEPKTFERLFKK